MSPRPCISVVGSSRATPASIAAATALGTALVDAGYRIVCGGRDGIMAATCRGARASSAWVDGTTVGILPGTDRREANAWVDVPIPTGLGLARNAVVVHAGQAVVAVAGSAGTLSEMALAWQLGKPLAALDTGEGWASRLADDRVDDRERAPVFRAASTAEVVAWLAQVLDDGPVAPRDEDV